MKKLFIISIPTTKKEKPLRHGRLKLLSSNRTDAYTSDRISRLICASVIVILGFGALPGCPDPCDELNPLNCMLPYPSDRYLVEDASTATGYRLKFEARAVPKNFLAQPFDTTPYERFDGMSPSSQIITLFSQPPDLAGAASQDDIGRSLEANSPTVILDLETGERVPHWTELDVQAESDAEKLLYLRPAVRLEENRAYGVAIRGLADIHGDPLESSPGFIGFRDDIATGSLNLELRRPSYENLFEELEAAGVGRDDLQAAWWFHTASGEAIRGDILSMREDALERLGADGIGCTITSVDNNHQGEIWRYVEGTFTVPSYMNSPVPPARFVRGPDDRPQFVEYVEVPFVANIPAALAEAPGGPVAGPLVTFGHGLLGTAEGYINSSNLRNVANRFATVIAGTDWDGMSSEDVPTLATVMLNSSNFPNMTERLQQGMINQIALTRTLAGVCRTCAELSADDGTPLIDPEALYFAGGSQGGIYGGTLLTLSPDIDRGILFVGAANYSLMLDRSIAFVPHFEAFKIGYPRRIDRALLIPAAQQLWEASDPAGYLPFAAEGLPGIGPKEILSIVAENDAQVPNLTSDLAARMAGLPVVAGSVRQPWGLEVRTAPYYGSGYLSIDLGDTPVPYGNEPPPHDEGGHGNVPFSETSLTISGAFLLEDGLITMPCEGVCDPD